MFSFRIIFKYIWPQMRKYRGAFFSLFIFFAIRTILEHIVRPVYFKKIIDLISFSGFDRAILSNDLFYIVGIIISISFLTLFTARLAKFIYFSFEINVIRELRNFSFQKIENHSQTFFSNTFAGSLVTKARRFVGSFETMFDIFIYSFLRFSVILIGVFVVLIFQSPIVSAIFTAWIIIHVSVVYFLTKRKVQYDLLEAEQDSKISGRLADVFSNILAVKFFSSRKSEIVSFGKYTDEGAARSRRAGVLGGKIDPVQHFFIILVQSVIFYITVMLWLEGKISTGTIVLIETYMVIIS